MKQFLEKNATAVGIFAGLLAIAIALPCAVKNFTDSSRRVTVKGLCEKEVMADKAIWPIVYKEGGNSVVSLASSVDAKNKAIVGWLKEAGFTDDEISVASPSLEDLKSNSYVENRTWDYVMTSVVTVCSAKVAEVVDLQGRQFDLLSRGIPIGSGNSWEHPVRYEYGGLNDIKPEMIEQATLSARQAAGKFAKDSGARVGRIITASQGQFSITDRDANTPYMKNVRVVTTITYGLK